MMRYFYFLLDYIVKRWRVFALSCGLQLFLTLALGLGLKAPQFLQPLNLNRMSFPSVRILPQTAPESLINKLLPKLQQKTDNFSLSYPATDQLLPQALAANDYDNLRAYIVIDNSSGKVLLEKNSHQELPIASLTKLMTAVVSLDLNSPDREFTVSDQAAQMIPTKIGVVAGQRMNLNELLKGALLTSANDAAEAVKTGVDNQYGQSIFVPLMNKKAGILGLKNTHFANAEGLDSAKNYSSAADLAVLSHFALANYPVIAGDVSEQYQFLPADSNHKQFDLYNWNGLLGVYPGAYGVKIGNTDAAGYTTIVAAKRNGKNVLVVALGAPGVLQRDLWAGELLDAGFQKLGVGPANISQAQLQAKYVSWKYWG